MFTGIISDVGEIVEMTPLGERRRLTIASAYDAAAIDVGAETLQVTTLRQWREGERVNLERALRVGDELGGHMVSGHVDGIAEILTRRDFDGMAHFRFRAPQDCARLIAVKGSVALDGTSLTVNAVEGAEFEVLLIPHTLEVTTWGERREGDRLNLEVDLIARYAARLRQAQSSAEA